MRLWHYELIPYLPKSQLLAQWRELNSIFVKEDKHILINYIYEYPKDDLLVYSVMVMAEMQKRGYKINTSNYNNYFSRFDVIKTMKKIDSNYKPFKNHHNFRYLQQCFYNLEEKYDRGQADFSQKQYEALNWFVTEKWLDNNPF